MRKIIIYTSLAMCLPGIEPTNAMDLRMDTPYMHQVRNGPTATVNSGDGVVYLRSRIEELEAQNKALKLKLEQSFNGDKSGLKSQNISLRETIKAQNEMLLSTDNAAKTAERLLTENAILQNKLDNNSNDPIVKDLVARNDYLQEELAKRDSYIGNLKKIADSVSHIKQNSSRELQNELYTLREKNMEYRSKIRKYKNELDTVEYGGASDSGEGLGYYKAVISHLENGIELKDKKISFLKVKNQELNARIKLLDKESKSAMLENDGGKTLSFLNELNYSNIEPASGSGGDNYFKLDD